LSYAIGVAKPTSVLVDTQGTGVVSDEWLAEEVQRQFELTPKGIISSLGLRKPIYHATATHGHFGRRPGECGVGTFSWEKTDKAASLRKAAEKAGVIGTARTVVEPKPIKKVSGKSSSKPGSKSGSKSSSKSSSKTKRHLAMA
jgi:hypothetical protein